MGQPTALPTYGVVLGSLRCTQARASSGRGMS